MKCGCYCIEDDGDSSEIKFCPLHAAAEELLRDLKYMVGGLHKSDVPEDIIKLISRIEGGKS